LSCLCLGAMDIVYLKEAAANEGAVCIDGTPAIYFFRAGSGVNSTKWALHILGGGFCATNEECLIRSQTLLGSSLYWPPSLNYGGPVSDNSTYNPDFYDWNHVFFAYCDGSSFSGNVQEPVSYKGKLLYYRGHRNLLAIFKDLFKNKGLGNATDVIITGDSAGALTTFYHIDEIRAMMPKSVTRFKAAPFSGVFLYYPNVEGKIVFGDYLKSVFNLHNLSGTINQKCISAMSPEYRHKCMFAQYIMLYIDTPLFTIGSAYDPIGTSCIVGGGPALGPSAFGGGNCSGIPGWAPCEDDPSKCTKEQWEKIEAYGETYMKILANHPKMKQDGNGFFECNCHTHAAESSRAWEVYNVDGVSMRDAVRSWYFSDNEPSSKFCYQGCVNHESYSCNPACSIPIK